MKTDWLEGEVFCYCINKDSEDRGTLADKIPLGGKYIVEYVWDGCVASDGLIFYFDEIKPVVRVKKDNTMTSRLERAITKLRSMSHEEYETLVNGKGEL